MGNTQRSSSKSKILLFGQRDPNKETSSSSAIPQIARSNKNPCDECEANHGPKWQRCVHGSSKKITSKQKQSSNFKFVGKLKEIDQLPTAEQGKRFRVTLIQEGLGNFQDCFYYTGDAIRSAVPLFEGSKYFVDHPTNSEEVDHPERSVKDIAGYYENLSAIADDDGRMSLVGDLVLLNGEPFDQYRSLMLESLAYSQKHDGDLVGLSINASGNFETVALDQFLKDEKIPDSCKTKLMEAQKMGITMIRPVREMKSAFSCDLVTTAGAGGRINTLLEQGKIKMKKEKGVNEEREEEGAAGDDGADGGGDAGGDGHADADQDEQLIMQMLKKYLGDGFSDEEKSMAKEAYQNSIEMGMDHAEAMKCAGYNMKMAKHLQGKQANQAEAGGSDDGKGVGVKSKAVGNAGSVSSASQHSESKQEEDESSQKESAKGNTVVKLAAEVARLTQKLNSMELKEYTEKSLRESRLPMSATKKFRECIKDVKSVKEFTEKLAIFKEAFGLRGEADDSGFILGAEKQSDISGAGMSFAGCVEE